MTDRDTRQAVAVAAVTAGLMIGFQTAAKATRDALFLSNFRPAALPTMVIVAAVVAVTLAFASTRMLTRQGPARVVPVAFGLSAALLFVEWGLATRSARLVAVLFYLHYAGLGAVLISSFWSVINERFDPRTAKRYLGRIAAGGTAGGIAGGVLAAQAADLVAVTTMLPLLAVLHVACGWLTLTLGRDGRGVTPAPGGDGRSGFHILTGTPYLRVLVALVLLTTVAEGMIDYVFKARAALEFGSGDALLRLFAWVYTGISAVALVVQTLGARAALQHAGLSRTIAVLPATVIAGGVGALLVPGFVPVLAARGLEAVTRNGIYRAGYELLFAPLPAAEKRATKALVDVGAVRLGDIVGGLLVQLTLVAFLAPERALLVMAVGVSLVAVLVTYGLRRGYTAALERTLLAHAGGTSLDEVQAAATRTALLHTAGAVGVTLAGLEPAEVEEPSAPLGPAAAPRLTPVPTAPPPDPEVTRFAALRSRDAEQVRAALQQGPLNRVLVATVVPLLAWDAVAREAIAALRSAAPQAVGLLADHLLDPEEEFAVRRRLPLVLAVAPAQRAADALVAALADRRFEVRYRSGRALTRLLGAHASLTVDQPAVRAAVLREVAVDRGVWESQRLLDNADDESPLEDELIRERANRSLEHVFTMLGLILPRQPLRVAFRGLHTDDRQLRGTALEYLESTLPEDIRRALWPFLEDHRTQGVPARPTETVLRELLESHASIVVRLERMREKPPAS